MKVDKKTIFAIVLGIAAVAVIIYQLRGVVSRGSSSISAAVAAPTPSQTVSSPRGATSSMAKAAKEQSFNDYAEFIERIDEDSLAYKSERFRNPMAALVAESDSDKPKISGPAAKVALGPSNGLALGYSIEGIVWNEAGPLAIVNNQVVGIGEQLDDGSRIVEIKKDTVRFTKQGREYYLIFREE